MVLLEDDKKVGSRIFMKFTKHSALRRSLFFSRRQKTVYCQAIGLGRGPMLHKLVTAKGVLLFEHPHIHIGNH